MPSPGKRAREVREALERHMPHGQWLQLSDIHKLIEANVPLYADDWRDHYRSNTWRPEPRWHGLVRRGLKRLQSTGDCEYQRPETYRLLP